MIKLSDLVFEFIAKNNISQVFMLPGGGAMHLVDSLGRNKRIKYIPMHHEQAVGIAAEYWGRIEGKPGVALVTTGPGATNIITPFVGAWIESVPLIVFSGQVKRKDIMKSDHGIRQLGVQEVNIVEMVNKHSKYAVTVLEPLRIRYHLEKAMYLMNKGRKGPVWIDIPLDVQAAKIPCWDKLESFFESSNLKLESEKELSNEIKNILDDFYYNLSHSQRPIALFGHGCRLSGGHKLVTKLINHLSLPSVFTWNSSDLLSYDNELYVGKPGNVALRAPNIAIQASDIFISFGARLDNIVTAYNPSDFARNAKHKYVIEVDQLQLNQCQLLKANKICIDFKLAAEYLLSKNKLEPFYNWQKHCLKLKNRFSICDGNIPTNSEYITHFEIIQSLGDLIPEDSLIVTGSSGLAIESFYTGFRNKKNQRILLTSGLGAMGYGLPAFIGGCYANKYKNKFLIESDGSLMLNIQELATLSNINERFKIIILNNDGYTSIRVTQDGYFKGNRVGSDLKSGLIMPNLKKICNSYNLNYVSLTKDNFNSLGDYLLSHERTIIDVKLIENEKLWPKVAAIQEPNGNMTSMPLEDMDPLIDIEDLKESLLNCEISQKSIKARTGNNL